MVSLRIYVGCLTVIKRMVLVIGLLFNFMRVGCLFILD